ncbi:serine hydrolase [Bacillus sp. H-16]|uniref:serine hydrolase n=1 Tax=Alteribacter salitolerans TaxID=2912333 RepID=UPI0019625D98|nr:serine hydrolase [Alteribacter salitolerans]MBM7097698.1 serine hydrolase [Alteribacter salitolerans]
MDFETLGHTVQTLSKKVNGDVSLHIHTEEGEIGYGSETPLIAASLIKVPCVYAAVLKSQEGTFELDEETIVSAEQKIGGTGVLFHMPGEVRITNRQLLSLMITVSDNTATNVIIDRIGIPYIQKTMVSAGCDSSWIKRKIIHTDPNTQPLNNIMSARDFNRILMAINQGKNLTEENREFILSSLTGQQINHKLPYLFSDGLPPTVRVAHKTGDDIGMEHNGGMICLNGKTAYVTMMTVKLETNIEGQEYIRKVGKAVYNYLSGYI